MDYSKLSDDELRKLLIAKERDQATFENKQMAIKILKHWASK